MNAPNKYVNSLKLDKINSRLSQNNDTTVVNFDLQKATISFMDVKKTQTT